MDSGCINSVKGLRIGDQFIWVGGNRKKYIVGGFASRNMVLGVAVDGGLVPRFIKVERDRVRKIVPDGCLGIKRKRRM